MSCLGLLRFVHLNPGRHGGTWANMWCGNVEKVHPLMEKLCFFEVVRGLMVFTQWEVMAWSFILRCLRQLSGGKSDTLSVHVCLGGIGDCTVSSVEGEEPPDAASRYLDPQGRISHKCIRDLEDFFGYTVLREDPSLLWSNISTCSARNPVRSSLCVPAVDLFFSFFFFVRNILVSDSSGSAGSPVLPTYRP